MCLGNLSLFRGNGLGKRFSESKKDLREQTGKKKRVIYFPLIYIYIYVCIVKWREKSLERGNKIEKDRIIDRDGRAIEKDILRGIEITGEKL